MNPKVKILGLAVTRLFRKNFNKKLFGAFDNAIKENNPHTALFLINRIVRNDPLNKGARYQRGKLISNFPKLRLKSNTTSYEEKKFPK